MGRDDEDAPSVEAAEGRALGDVTTLRDPAVMDALAIKVAEEEDEE